MRLVDVLVRALTHRPDPDEADAWSRPPYPTPAALVPAQERIVAELVARLPSHGERPVAVRIRGPVRTCAEAVHLLGHGPFDLSDAGTLLIASEAIASADVPAVRDAASPVTSRSMGRQLVLNHLAAGDVTGATAAADALDDDAWVGHRDVARHHAMRGDAASALAGWRRCAAGRDRTGMDALREQLVEAVATREGWRPAVELTHDKRIGSALAPVAFRPWAATGDVDGIAGTLRGEAAGLLDPADELDVLVGALTSAGVTDPPLLQDVIDRITALDPTASTARMRRRDEMLFRLWPVIGDRETLRLVRAAVRTPGLRRELTRLASEI